MTPAGPHLYDLFWENSKLNAATGPAFAARLAAYTASAWSSTRFEYATPDVPLERANDALAALMQRRRSERRFSNRPVASAKLGRLFSAFAGSPAGSRTFPSAGATYPLEVFCLLNNVEGPLNGHVVYYNHDRHSLSVVGKAPPWDAYAPTVNVETAGVPQLVFVFALVSERATIKYGERGGRFALIEVGHAAQNLALRLAQERMVGCPAGGLHDDSFAALLGLPASRPDVALGYLCGFAAPRRGAPSRAVPAVLRRLSLVRGEAEGARDIELEPT